MNAITRTNGALKEQAQRGITALKDAKQTIVTAESCTAGGSPYRPGRARIANRLWSLGCPRRQLYCPEIARAFVNQCACYSLTFSSNQVLDRCKGTSRLCIISKMEMRAHKCCKIPTWVMERMK